MRWSLTSRPISSSASCTTRHPPDRQPSLISEKYSPTEHRCILNWKKYLLLFRFLMKCYLNWYLSNRIHHERVMQLNWNHFWYATPLSPLNVWLQTSIICMLQLLYYLLMEPEFLYIFQILIKVPIGWILTMIRWPGMWLKCCKGARSRLLGLLVDWWYRTIRYNNAFSIDFLILGCWWLAKILYVYASLKLVIAWEFEIIFHSRCRRSWIAASKKPCSVVCTMTIGRLSWLCYSWSRWVTLRSLSLWKSQIIFCSRARG